MKKTSSIAVLMLMLCSAILIVNLGIAMAVEPGYTYSEYYMGAAVTADGKWTNADEWHDVPTAYIPTTGPHVGLWEYKMDTTDYTMSWLIEFADNTNDAGDRFEICVDGDNDGATLDANDVKIVIEGHTTMKTYIGSSGTTWAASTWTATFANTITTSPHDPAPHWVCEIKFSKSQWGWGANPPPHGIRVAMYDASKPAQGWVAWPPEAVSKDNPARWGSMPDYMAAPAPEGLTIGVMLLVSSVAVVVSVRYFRKPPKL